MFKPYIRYAEFSGRSSRSEYWLFTLFYVLTYLLLAAVGSVLFGADKWGILSGIFALGSMIPSIAVTVRRLHDSNRSGWNYFWLLLPIIGGIILLVFMCMRGTPGPNSYGMPDDGLDYDDGGAGDAYSNSQLNELEKLGRLRDNGVLTEDEFQARKIRVLGA